MDSLRLPFTSLSAHGSSVISVSFDEPKADELNCPGGAVPGLAEGERRQLDADGGGYARLWRRRRQQQLVNKRFSSLFGSRSFIDCLMVQLAAHSRLYRIQIRRVSKRRVTCSTPANPRSSCSCLSVLHPTLRPRFETLGHRIHEKTARQSQHHSYLG